jgi:hypothetical protein
MSNATLALGMIGNGSIAMLVVRQLVPIAGVPRLRMHLDSLRV